jgi:hypothetical protein
MEGLGFSPQLMGDGSVKIGDDSRLFVQFYPNVVLDHAATAESEDGQPVFKTVDYVKIQQPGERDLFDAPATEEHKHRFPRQWDLYRSGKEQHDGTPLALMFVGDRAHIAEMLKARKVFTVEQLANLSEDGVSRIGMGARQLVEQAKRFLDTMKRGHASAETERRMRELEQQVEGLRNELASRPAAPPAQKPKAA